MSPTADFISELIRAANEAERLAMHERANLLHRAAATIRDFREEINFSGTPANDSGRPGEIVHDLRRIADRVREYHPEQVKTALLDAVQAIKALRILLEEKEKIERGEE